MSTKEPPKEASKESVDNTGDAAEVAGVLRSGRKRLREPLASDDDSQQANPSASAAASSQQPTLPPTKQAEARPTRLVLTLPPNLSSPPSGSTAPPTTPRPPQASSSLRNVSNTQETPSTSTAPSSRPQSGPAPTPTFPRISSRPPRPPLFAPTVRSVLPHQIPPGADIVQQSIAALPELPNYNQRAEDLHFHRVQFAIEVAKGHNEMQEFLSNGLEALRKIRGLCNSFDSALYENTIDVSNELLLLQNKAVDLNRVEANQQERFKRRDDDFHAHVAGTKEGLSAREKAVTEKEVALTDREKAIAGQEKAVAGRNKILDDREKAVADREKDLDEREKGLDKRAEDLEEAENEIEAVLVEANEKGVEIAGRVLQQRMLLDQEEL